MQVTHFLRDSDLQQACRSHCVRIVIRKYEMFALFKCIREAAAGRNKIKMYDVTPVRTYETSLRS